LASIAGISGGNGEGGSVNPPTLASQLLLGAPASEEVNKTKLKVPQLQQRGHLLAALLLGT